MATRNEIYSWFQDGLDRKYSHMIIVYDEFDHEDFPLYCESRSEANREVSIKNAMPMTRVMEVYNLSIPIEKQLDAHWAWNF